jgi:hypothetical protein
VPLVQTQDNPPRCREPRPGVAPNSGSSWGKARPWRERALRRGVHAARPTFAVSEFDDNTLFGIGFMYGFNYYGLLLRAGVVAASGDYAPLQLVAQAGFAPLL